MSSENEKPVFTNELPAKNYINNDELMDELRKSKALGKPTQRLTEMFQLLARRVSGSFIYDSNEDRYDCVLHSFTILMEKWNKFDFEKNTNAFSFYTQVALNGLRAGWNLLNGKKKYTVSIDRIFIESV